MFITVVPLVLLTIAVSALPAPQDFDFDAIAGRRPETDDAAPWLMG